MNKDDSKEISKKTSREILELTQLKKKVEDSLSKAPEGKLWCEMTRGSIPQYFIRIEEEKTMYPRGRFLRKEEHHLATALAQKEYDQKILKSINHKIILLRGAKTYNAVLDPRDVYDSLPPAKKRIVKPYFPTDEEFLTLWKNNHPQGGNSYISTNEYITEQGENVRSKSEKLIADKLFMRKIPYVYEAPLTLARGYITYPDFTILNVRTRETFYLEHFGMMDNSDYCKKALEKIDLYEANSIYLGEKLLVSFESSTKGIHMLQIDSLIDRLLI